MTQCTAIIGGGLTGILCALRFSKHRDQEANQIVLIDSNETLGGRFFFDSSENKRKSGFGFEYEDLNDLETLKRHLFLYLDEDEKNFLEKWVHDKLEQTPLEQKQSKSYFIKKNTLETQYIVLTNSEFLTKKEAEFLSSIVHLDKQSIFDENKDVAFADYSAWKNAHKSIRENITPILECLLGKYFSNFSLQQVHEGLSAIFSEESKIFDPFFLRIVEIELAFERILRDRGLKIYTQCSLKSLEQENEHYKLCLIGSQNTELICQKIIFTIPPSYLKMLIAKEHLSPELSRFMNKVQPSSLICLELNELQEKCLEHIQKQLIVGNHFYFPVEGSFAQMTSDGRLIAAIELDYETSLQAPAVREALTRLRRSARRILKPEFADELKKGAFIRKVASFEKVVLLSVAHNVPNYSRNLQIPPLSDITCRFKNVYFIGDYLHSLGDSRWKRIIKSIDILCKM